MGLVKVKVSKEVLFDVLGLIDDDCGRINLAGIFIDKNYPYEINFILENKNFPEFEGDWQNNPDLIKISIPILRSNNAHVIDWNIKED